MKRLAVYYRVSTDKQDLRSQRMAVETWLSERNLVPARVFQDEARSGKDEKRPGYRAMLDAAYSGEIDTIIVYKLDRFSRSASRAIRTLLELDELGVGFVSVTQAVLNLSSDTPFKKTMLAAFAEIAQIERETISGRVKAGLAAAKRAGKTLGRKPSHSPETVAEIKALRAKGYSFDRIARSLNLPKSTAHRLSGERRSTKRPNMSELNPINGGH